MLWPARLFQRRPDTHKADFGHVFILAGSGRLTGAACLCAEAAMRAGTGLVTLGFPEGLYQAIVKKLIPEVMTLSLPATKQQTLSEAGLKEIKKFLKKIDCLVIGPGLSQNPSTQRLIRSVVSYDETSMVVDADGLNALVGHVSILKNVRHEVVLTPHPGEMARLIGISVKGIQANRKKVAKEFALLYNKTLVLKGYKTVVASVQGTTYVNRTGNPGMATAGSGDVLSGIVAAFLAQGVSAFEAAKFGVYIHGLAGDLVAKDKTQVGLIASDIIDYLPKAFKRSLR